MVASFASSDVAVGIEMATAAGARVISLSLTAPPSPGLEQAVRSALATAVVVAAAGTRIGRMPSPVGYPAAYPGVIAVGAVDRRDDPIDSPEGYRLGLLAPGQGLCTTTFRDLPHGRTAGYRRDFSGTSAAAALVAGAAALLLSASPALSARDATAVLLETARRVPRYHAGGGQSRLIGRGILDVAAAVRAVTG